VTSNLPFQEWTEILDSERLVSPTTFTYLPSYLLVRFYSALDIMKRIAVVQEKNLKRLDDDIDICSEWSNRHTGRVDDFAINCRI
jgi:hypothetical protein